MVQQGKRIKITNHAKQRLKERVATYKGYRSWEHLVRTARYSGKSEKTMNEAEYEWCATHLLSLYSSSKVRLWNGFVFLFMGNKGHARTLVTVIPLSI